MTTYSVSCIAAATQYVNSNTAACFTLSRHGPEPTWGYRRLRAICGRVEVPEEG